MVQYKARQSSTQSSGLFLILLSIVTLVAIVLSIFAFLFSSNQKNNNNTEYPAGDYITQQQLNDTLKNYVKQTDLDNYAKQTDLDNYAKQTDLDNYTPISELDNYAKQTDLDNYAEVSDLDNYAKLSDLDNYSKYDDVIKIRTGSTKYPDRTSSCLNMSDFKIDDDGAQYEATFETDGVGSGTLFKLVKLDQPS